MGKLTYSEDVLERTKIIEFQLDISELSERIYVKIQNVKEK
jgi:hypothetical protein